jgi:AAHS family 4-hydroxybenzoate transporter-like MFS transporter
MQARDNAVDVARLIDAGAWTGYQKWLVFLVALTIVFDGIDNQLLGIVIPTVMAEWDVPRSAFAPVVSFGYGGMMVGGLIAGFIGDRIGRRAALLGSMWVFGVLTVAAAFIGTSPMAWFQNVLATIGLGGDPTTALTVLRFLAGIGLGGAMPNAAALAAEYVPARMRPVAVTVTIVCVPLGGTLAGLLGIQLLPAVGWRNLFVLGGIVPVVAAIALRWLLPESPQFLARRRSRWVELVGVMKKIGHSLPTDTAFVDPGAGRGVQQASFGTLFSREYRRDTMALWGSFFSCLLAVYLGFSWLTTLLTGAGFDPATANTGITAFNLGGVIGALLGGVVISRLGSRLAMLSMTGVAIAGAAGLATMTISPAASLIAIMAMLTLTGSMINGVQTTMYALAAHVYPTAVRARGVGTAVAFGRIGAFMVGFIGSWAADMGGTNAFFAVVAGMMVVTFISLALVTRHVPAADGAVRS